MKSNYGKVDSLLTFNKITSTHLTTAWRKFEPTTMKNVVSIPSIKHSFRIMNQN